MKSAESEIITGTFSPKYIAVVLVVLTGIAIAINGLLNSANYTRPVTIDYLAEQAEPLSIESASTSPDWKSMPTVNHHFGVNVAPHWFRFSLTNTGKPAKVIDIPRPFLDSIEVWYVHDDEVIEYFNTGDHLPFSQRPILSESFVFGLWETEEPVDIYVRVASKSMMHVPIRVWDGDDLLRFYTRTRVLFGLCIGFVLSLAIRNLIWYTGSGVKTFGVYSGLHFSLILFILAFDGSGFRFIWPTFPGFQQVATFVFLGFMLCWSAILVPMLMGRSPPNTWFGKIERMLPYIGFSIVPLTLVLANNFLFYFTLLAAIFIVGFALIRAFLLGIQGNTMARGLFIAWSIAAAIASLSILESVGFKDTKISHHYYLLLAFTFEALLITMLMADAFKMTSEQSFEAQQDALEKERQLLAAEKEVLALEQQSAEDLEYKVQERTWELEVALRELSEVNEELEKLTNTDALTGARNRRYFDKHLLAEARRSWRENVPLSLAIIDIDFFKKVNDTHGHHVGDQVLKQLGRLIGGSLKRTSDRVCRYGGEEFAVILPNTELQGAVDLMEALRVKIQETDMVTDAGDLRITVSIGVSTTTVSQDGEELGLFKAADECLYEAKQSGRNLVCSRPLHESQSS